MKKTTLGNLIFSVLVIGSLYLNVGCHRPCTPPEKPNSVPGQAIWKGDCDGGNWIVLSEVKGEQYRFQVYRGYDGVLEMDADFELAECTNANLSNENWQEAISHYWNDTDSSVHIELVNNADCRLTAIYPAYGGDDWQIIKDKYNLQ